MKYKFVTTMSKDYYDKFGSHMIDSFLNFYESANLVVYTEDFIPTQAVEHVSFSSLNNDLEDFLVDLGDSRARGFAYKAYAVIHALEQKDFDRFVYLDADLLFFRHFSNKDLLNWMPAEYGFAYLGVTHDKYGSHADTCFFIIDASDTNYELFLENYKSSYTKRKILSKEFFVKPNDSYVFSYALKACKDAGSLTLDWHKERSSLSPMNESILGKYMRHFKASRKDNLKVIGEIQKLSNAILKGKDIDTVVERFDRRVRKKS
jgi:hypothetical protein